jgi:hypothetical protein
MPRITYVGPIDEVDIPVAGCSVKRGESFEVPAPVADRLLEQPDNFTKTTDAKASKNAQEG